MLVGVVIDRNRIALANLKRLCDQHLAGRYKLEIIDLLQHPERAKADQIVAIPTLVRQLPPPLKRIMVIFRTGSVLSSGSSSIQPDHRRAT
ncbi:circadian clock KaiB family protein [Roseiarcus sp.]|uniref:circadian clock KaiB family protein n=1 Tax=Roseiarcus sp. TaxID=1969460 RepID=UPI003F96CE4B